MGAAAAVPIPEILTLAEGYGSSRARCRSDPVKRLTHPPARGAIGLPPINGSWMDTQPAKAPKPHHSTRGVEDGEPTGWAHREPEGARLQMGRTFSA